MATHADRRDWPTLSPPFADAPLFDTTTEEWHIRLDF